MSAGPLRWARCRAEGRLHLVSPVDTAPAAGLAGVCGVALDVVDLTITGGTARLCAACIAAAADHRGATAGWALSPYDCAAHLLLGAPRPDGQRLARCGAVLPDRATVCDRPWGVTCAQCALFALADGHAPGRFARRAE